MGNQELDSITLSSSLWLEYLILLVSIIAYDTSLVSVLIPLLLQEKGTIRAIAASLAFKALLVVGLFVAIFVTPGLGFLSILLPVLVLIFLLLVAVGTQLYASGRAAITAATMSALILAWSMSTTFPIT